MSIPNLTDEITACDRASPFAGGGYANMFVTERKRPDGRLEQVAVKVLRIQKNDIAGLLRIERRLRKELFIWKDLDHPNILNLYGICTNFGPHAAMVSPWYKNGNVLQYVKDLKPVDDTSDVRLRLLCGAAEGITYLHSMDPPIAHGDITCVNILVDDNGEARICDFGLSKVLDIVQTSTGTGIDPSSSNSSSCCTVPCITSTAFAGSVRWMAPELIRLSDENIVRSVYMDVYSFGCIAYELLSGEIPFQYLTSDLQVIAHVMKGNVLARPSEEGMTRMIQEEWWKYIQLCCSLQPEDRPTMGEVAKVFKVFRWSWRFML